MTVGRPYRGCQYTHAYFLTGAARALQRGDIGRAQEWLDSSFELTELWGKSQYSSELVEKRARDMRIALHTLLMNARMARLDREGALLDLHATRVWSPARKAV